MNKYNVKFLLFLILCFNFTTVLCQDQGLWLDLEELESIPISSPIGPKLVQMAQTQDSLNSKDIRQLLLSIDRRGIDENNPSYALLNMKSNLVYKTTKIILSKDMRFKGSGTVLFCSNSYILVLTAYHNLYRERGIKAYNTTQMSFLEDNRDKKHTENILAEMVNNNYIQVGQKDIALVAMKLENGNNFFKNDRIIYDILDFNNTHSPGQHNGVSAEINQYPAFFDWYIKINGTAYHDRGIGYHFIPTLPGSSGSSVIINNSIVGVHVSRGIEVSSSKKNIKYNDRNLLVKNNIFELLSIDEIEQVSADLNNSGTKAILADLIRKYISGINKQKREKLIEYLEHGRKVKKDKDTNPEFLKEINKLNAEKRFWTSYLFWAEKIEEITDEIVEAYNSVRVEL